MERNDEAVRMLPAQTAFMERMRQLVPASIPLMVTSGYRSPADQAAADASKINRGETLSQLSRLYGNNAAAQLLFTGAELF